MKAQTFNLGKSRIREIGVKSFPIAMKCDKPSAALPPNRLWNLEAIWEFSQHISRDRDLKRSYDKTSYCILKRAYGRVSSALLESFIGSAKSFLDCE